MATQISFESYTPSGREIAAKAIMFAIKNQKKMARMYQKQNWKERFDAHTDAANLLEITYIGLMAANNGN